MTWAGMWTSLIFVNLIGVAIATGVATTPGWSDAYATSSGALILACYEGLGAFGGFCTVLIALVRSFHLDSSVPNQDLSFFNCHSGRNCK